MRNKLLIYNHCEVRRMAKKKKAKKPAKKKK